MRIESNLCVAQAFGFVLNLYLKQFYFNKKNKKYFYEHYIQK
jgi:hypothetical protein